MTLIFLNPLNEKWISAEALRFSLKHFWTKIQMVKNFKLTILK